MAIFKNYRIKKVRELGSSLGREGISLEVIKAIEEFDGSYKGAMELTGKLVLWADASTFDEYWQEQVERGLSKALNRACDLASKPKTYTCHFCQRSNCDIGHDCGEI